MKTASIVLSWTFYSIGMLLWFNFIPAPEGQDQMMQAILFTAKACFWHLVYLDYKQGKVDKKP